MAGYTGSMAEFIDELEVGSLTFQGDNAGDAVTITGARTLNSSADSDDSIINFVTRGGRRGAGTGVQAANVVVLEGIIAEMVATGKRTIYFPGAGAASGDSNFGFNAQTIVIPAMPPVHVDGPVEPVRIIGDGYGSTQLYNGNISTLSPIIGENIQFRTNFILEGPVSGSTTYPHRFRNCGFTDAGLFFKVKSRVFFDGCSFKLDGNGPLLAHLAAADTHVAGHFSNCEIGSSYLVSGSGGGNTFIVDEISVVGGIAGTIHAWVGLASAGGTVTVAKTAGVIGIADESPDA